VDPRFVGTHARLCRSIRYVDIAKRLAPGAPHRLSTPLAEPPAQRTILRSLTTPRRSFTFLATLGQGFLAAWLLFPNKLRITAYDLLRKVGEMLYGKSNGHSTVQRLPFGLYLKYQREPEGFRNEFNALKAVQQHTSLPVPTQLDIVSKEGDPNDRWASPEAYLLITRLPGLPLHRCHDVLSDKDCEHIAMQMKDYLTQLRDIPKTVNPHMAVCNTLGEACRDPRIRGGESVGPFSDEAAFSQSLRFSDEPSRRGHKIVFTHADLNPRNILVSEGSSGWSITGIVDWETAGYYPEYWDFTKAMFEGFRWPLRYNDLVKGIFAEFGDYSQELDVERRSWESGDGV
jgi:hypothetical protein